MHQRNLLHRRRQAVQVVGEVDCGCVAGGGRWRSLHFNHLVDVDRCYPLGRMAETHVACCIGVHLIRVHTVHRASNCGVAASVRVIGLCVDVDLVVDVAVDAIFVVDFVVVVVVVVEVVVVVVVVMMMFVVVVVCVCVCVCVCVLTFPNQAGDDTVLECTIRIHHGCTEQELRCGIPQVYHALPTGVRDQRDRERKRDRCQPHGGT